ncbi:MAG: T9SS type A sorting domain-containing protein [bacterium]
MKKIILIIILLANAISQCYSYGSTSKVWIAHEDKVDSVLIGIDNNSTIGIDTLFGEKDIKDIPMDDFEIRVIQRDTVNYNCLIDPSNKTPIYSPNNFDTKIDYRPDPNGELWEIFHSINFNFEIITKSNKVPCNIYADFKMFYGYIFGGWALLDSNCDLIIYGFFGEQLLYTITDSQQYTLIVHIEFDIGVDGQNQTSDWNIYPVPAIDKIQISDFGVTNGNIEISDVIGNIVYSINVNGNEKLTISIDDYTPGVYFVRIYDKDKQTYSVRRFIKL